MHSLYGHIKLSISLSGTWCRIRAYLSYVCFCAFYYSFVLQAIFRFFRVVYHRKRTLQQSYVYIIAICIQWGLSFTVISPHIILDDFQYQSFDYTCWISLRNIRGVLLAIFNIYGCPILIIFVIYGYIIHYVRQTVVSQRDRRKLYKRDAIVLRRIVLLLTFLVLFGVTTHSVLVIYSITSYLLPFAYDIQAVNISIGLVVTPVTLVFVTPKMRHAFKPKNRAQYPTMPRRNFQYTITDSSRQHTEN